MPNTDTPSQTLPPIGLSRWETLAPFIDLSRKGWENLVKRGLAPAPQRLGARCVLYSNAEIHRWLADPAGYRAGTRSAEE